MYQLWILVCGAALVAGQYPNPGLVTGDVGAHDPSMIPTSAGYYLYSTHNGIEIRHSTDRIAFSRNGSVFTNTPSWWGDYGTTDPWAPDINNAGGKYLLYYAVSTFGSQNSALALATSSNGQPGTWSDQGTVLTSRSGDPYNCIDPNLLVDSDGSWWLSFGSFWNGIYMIRLDPSTGKQDSDDRTAYHLAFRPSGSHAVEASSLFKHGSRYYLFVSFDTCCAGVDSTYKVMVGRSDRVTGPYVDRSGTDMLEGGGTEILATHGRYIGTGGQDVMTDVDGDLLIYHYYDGEDNGAPKLGVNLIGWDDQDWPYVY